jgi:hypothetical protein
VIEKLITIHEDYLASLALVEFFIQPVTCGVGIDCFESEPNVGGAQSRRRIAGRGEAVSGRGVHFGLLEE